MDGNESEKICRNRLNGGDVRCESYGWVEEDPHTAEPGEQSLNDASRQSLFLVTKIIPPSRGKMEQMANHSQD
jgi:hypothetical protein